MCIHPELRILKKLFAINDFYEIGMHLIVLEESTSTFYKNWWNDSWFVLYARFLGIGAIRIQTAGQSPTATGYEGQLSGLVQWDDLHQQLRSKLKLLHPIAEATAVAESVPKLSSDDKLQRILEELKAIRKVLENK